MCRAFGDFEYRDIEIEIILKARGIEVNGNGTSICFQGKWKEDNQDF